MSNTTTPIILTEPAYDERFYDVALLLDLLGQARAAEQKKAA